jgi:hypothetical protein
MILFGGEMDRLLRLGGGRCAGAGTLLPSVCGASESWSMQPSKSRRQSHGAGATQD